jgi:hypothetical protein
VDLAAADPYQETAGGWHVAGEDDDGLRILWGAPPEGQGCLPVTIGGSGAYAVVVAGGVARAVGSGAQQGMVHAGCVTWCPPGTRFAVPGAQPGTRIALLQFPGASGRGGSTRSTTP